MVMEVATFAEIQDEFLAIVNNYVYCNVATVDTKNRPRSRIMHPVWEGETCWICSYPKSPKAKHLQHNPHVSLAYFCHDSRKPVYIDCTAAWVTDRVEQQRVWDYYKVAPRPMGFDLDEAYGSLDHEHFGLLKLTPWRIELCELWGESRIWQRK
jgi:general stress protein 26